jgi:hypothetical protein
MLSVEAEQAADGLDFGVSAQILTDRPLRQSCWEMPLALTARHG